MDHDTLTRLRKQHAGWRLLTADSAPLIVSFLHDAFIRPNARSIRQDQLVEALDEYLHRLHEDHGASYPRKAQAYLDDWASGEVAYLRKYYPADSDEPEFDLTPATERVIEWLQSLTQRQFVGTESRLLTIFQLLREIVSASETDPAVRIAELERRKAELDREIEKLRDGRLEPYNATQVKERFLQAEETARRLLSDFRQVEENFRLLDRQTRARIATSAARKGELLDAIFGEQHAIADSDQGRSFRAFWTFLMSTARQDELTALVARTLALEPVGALAPDELLPRLQYHLLEAGEKVQRTSATLVEQLRRYLDDQVWLENKRIVEIIRGIEQQAVAIAQTPPPDKAFATLDDLRAEVALPFARALFVPTTRARLDSSAIHVGEAAFDAQALFEQHHVDEEALRENVRRLLRDRPQVTLGEVVAVHPVARGLAEVVAYWRLACGDPRAHVDDDARERIMVPGEDGGRVVSIPMIIFTREARP